MIRVSYGKHLICVGVHWLIFEVALHSHPDRKIYQLITVKSLIQDAPNPKIEMILISFEVVFAQPFEAWC